MTMVSNQRSSSRLLLLVRRGIKRGDEPPSKGAALPRGLRLPWKGRPLAHPALESGSSTASARANASSGGAHAAPKGGRRSPAKAVRFQLDERPNVQRLVRVHESPSSADDDDDGDGDDQGAAAAWSSREELRRQKRLATDEARAYARDHPEYVRVLELLLGSPVNPRPDRGSERVSTEFEALQVLGTCPVRGLEGHCTPALGRHRKWATCTILHVYGQQLRHRRSTPCCRDVGNDGGGDGDGGSSMSYKEGDDDDESLLLLRRCCEFVNRASGALAAAIGAADAWAASNVHREEPNLLDGRTCRLS
jgi:hypothetical protein